MSNSAFNQLKDRRAARASNGFLATHTGKNATGMIQLRALEVSDPFQQADQQT